MDLWELLEKIAPAAAVVLSGAMVLFERRGALIITLSGLYGLTSALALSHLAFAAGIAKVLVGILVCGILILAHVGGAQDTEPGKERGGIPQGRAFRLVACLLVGGAGLGMGQTQAAFFAEIPLAIRQTSMYLLVFGLLGLGLFQETFRHGLGLLTMLIGFDLAYSMLEPSLAIAALMATVHLGIALALVYLEAMEEQRLGGETES